MQSYQYFIQGTVDASGLHNLILANSNLNPQMGYIQMALGTDISANDGYYVFIYFNNTLNSDDKATLDSIVAGYTP